MMSLQIKTTKLVRFRFL